MKNWFNRNKYLFIIFGIVSIVLFGLMYVQISYILQPEVLEQLQVYSETGEISKSLAKYSMLAFVSLIVFGIWAILFVVIIFKVIFPTKKSVKDAFLYDNYKYLYNLPSEIRKGLKKYEQ